MYKGHKDISLGIYDLLSFVARDPRTIVDLGAHQGSGYKKMRSFFPDADIHLVEPVEDCVQAIKETVGEDPRVFVHQCAIGKSNETMLINVFPSDGRQSSNFYSDRSQLYGKPTRVPVQVRKYDFLPDCIDLAKINIEAGEYELLETEYFDRVESFVMEAHNNLIPGKTWRDVVDILGQKFDLVTVGDLNYKYCFVLGMKI